MARILFASLLLLVFGSSLAQTFACQFIASSGLNWNSGRWESTSFHTHEPFFFGITAENGITSFKGNYSLERLPLTCDKKARELKTHSCSTASGTFIYFSESTQRGGIATLFGSSLLEKDERDSLSVQPFVCQKL